MRGNFREEGEIVDKKKIKGPSWLVMAIVLFPPGNSTTGKSPWLPDESLQLENSQQGREVILILPITSVSRTSKCKTFKQTLSVFTEAGWVSRQHVFLPPMRRDIGKSEGQLVAEHSLLP